MDLSLYAKVRVSARYTHSLVVRRRINLFLKVIKSENVSLSCESFGVSRTNYYRWWNLFVGNNFNVGVLENKSRKPKRHPKAVSVKVIRHIKFYRKQYRYGPERIQFYLKQNHKIEVSLSTIGRVIKRCGLILKVYRTKKKNPHRKRYNLQWPGQMLQMDIKYVPYKINGQQYYAFNAIDDATRWRFARIYPDKSLKSCLDFTKDLIRYAPFTIQAIQTDNDIVFTNRFAVFAPDPNFHEFTAFLEANEIYHRLIPPGAKELNGKVERSHRTDDDEFYWKSPRHSLEALKRSFVQWIWEYNHDRPHKSLNRATPMEKLLEKTILSLFSLALIAGLDPLELYKPIPITTKTSTMADTYLRYLQYLESIFLPVTDDMRYYIFNPSL